MQEAGREGHMPTDFLEHDRNLGEAQRQNFSKALRAGVKMSFGPDAGVCPYDVAARQFAFMVKYGMTPLQAIQSATSTSPDLPGKPDLLGPPNPGTCSDILSAT